MEFVWVPGGCFLMGSPQTELNRETDEGPVHEVCVEGFWMGRTEVTNAQYRTFHKAHNGRSSRRFPSTATRNRQSMSRRRTRTASPSG